MTFTTLAKKWELGFVLTVRKRVDFSFFFFTWRPRSIFETQQAGELYKEYLWLRSWLDISLHCPTLAEHPTVCNNKLHIN